jgi:hypothetical protein
VAMKQAIERGTKKALPRMLKKRRIKGRTDRVPR